MDYSAILGGAIAQITNLVDSGLGQEEAIFQAAASNKAYLPRFAPEEGKAHRVFPFYIMELPFNPVTGKQDDRFNNKTRFRLPSMSFTTAMYAVRELANKNPALRQSLIQNLGSEEMLDWPEGEKLPDDVRHAWHNAFGNVHTFTRAVQSIHFPSEGREFSYKVGAAATYNPETNGWDGIGALYKAACIENKIIAKQIKAREDEMMKEQQSADQISLAKENIRKSKMVSMPYWETVMPVFVIPLKSNKPDEDDEAVKTFIQGKDISKCLKWMRVKADNVVALKTLLKDERADHYDDFFEFKYDLGPADSKQDPRTTVKPEACSRDYSAFYVKSGSTPIIAEEDVIKSVHEMLDDEESQYMSFEKWQKSIGDFKKKAEDEVINLLKNNFPGTYNSKIAELDLDDSYIQFLTSISNGLTSADIANVAIETVAADAAEKAKLEEIENEIAQDTMDSETGDKTISSTEATEMFKAEEASAAVDMNALLGDED